MSKQKSKKKRRSKQEIAKNYSKIKPKPVTKTTVKSKSTAKVEKVKVSTDNTFDRLPLNTIKKDLVKTFIFALVSFGLIFYIDRTGIDFNQLMLVINSVTSGL